MNYEARILRQANFSDFDYSNEQSIAYMRLTAASKINKTLVYTWGMNDDRFPLTMATLGNGQTLEHTKLNDVEFEFDVMGRMRFNDMVVKAPVETEPGRNNSLFKVWFKSRLLIEQFGIIGPDGRSRCRIMGRPVKDDIGYCYILANKNPDPDNFIDPTLFTPGSWWSLTISTIPESFSRGNRATVMGPTKMKGQIGFHRFTKEIAGNLANKVVEYEFKTRNGGTTNLWINEEMRQFDIYMQMMREESLWLSRYNRLENGEIRLKDEDNGNPIPESLGMFEVCEGSNYDTYGENLYLEKIERTIGDVLNRDTDTGQMEVVLFAGRGFRQDFTRAIEDKAVSRGFAQALGEKYIQGDSMSLMYGGTFTKYKLDSGDILTVKPLPLLDKGTLAENDKSNGRIHPRTGLPISSHQALLVDFSTYDGERNVKLAEMKGQEYLQGIIKGLTPTPPSWGPVPQNSLATDVDHSTYEVKMSSGLHVCNTEKFFLLQSVI